jgi:tripartite-type tricarboxylate transporter receptor subunit TctC
MSVFRKALGSLLLGASLVLPMAPAVAQDFPSRPIRLICPYAAGGLTDVVARLLAKHLGERIGQSVVVENRTGGGGIIAMEAAAKAPADGYTIVLVGQGLASVNASLRKDLSYDTLRDFSPVSLVSTFSMVFVAHPERPPKTFADWIAMARAKPGALNYGSAGNASTAHLMTELLKDQIGIDVQHIPFRGESQAFLELMGGRLDGMFATLGGAMPHIQSGKLRAIAVATKERSSLLPDVPTVSEAGAPGFEVLGWYGILAPAKVPKPVLDRLDAEFAAIAREPEFRAQMQARGMEAVGGSGGMLTKWISDETVRWRDVVNKAGIKAE